MKCSSFNICGLYYQILLVIVVCRNLMDREAYSNQSLLHRLFVNVIMFVLLCMKYIIMSILATHQDIVTTCVGAGARGHVTIITLFVYQRFYPIICVCLSFNLLTSFISRFSPRHGQYMQALHHPWMSIR